MMTAFLISSSMANKKFRKYKNTSLEKGKNREIALVLLLSVRILTSADDKDDNDITEPERDDDRLFDLFFDGERLRDLVLWRPRFCRLDFFPAKTTSEAAQW